MKYIEFYRNLSDYIVIFELSVCILSPSSEKITKSVQYNNVKIKTSISIYLNVQSDRKFIILRSELHLIPIIVSFLSVYCQNHSQSQ